MDEIRLLNTDKSNPAYVRVATNQQKLLFRECDPKTMTISNIGCTICKKEFDSKVAIRKHLHCHICFTNPCKTLEEAPEDLFEITLCIGESAHFEVRNVGKYKVSLGHVYLINKNNATLYSFDDDCCLEIGDTKVFNMERNLMDSAMPNTIIIQAFTEEEEYFEYFVLSACCGNPNELKKTLELTYYDERNKELKSIMAKSDMEIDSYFKFMQANGPKFDKTTYKSIFFQLSMIERASNQTELDKYELLNIDVKTVSDNHIMDENDKDTNLYEVYVENVKDKFNQLTNFDLIKLTNRAYPLDFTANIYKLFKNHIVFETMEPKNGELKFDPKLRYDMTFHISSYSYDMELAALDFVNDEGLVSRLFPTSINCELPHIKREFDWINPDIAENELQMQAVRHIVEGTSHPAPYILYGPPGTGKTKTLVEAISQIYTQDETSRILVCATSNSAADEIATRLIQNFPNICWIEHHVYRLYSTAYTPEFQIEENLRTSSNFDLNLIPDLKFLHKFRIIISTLLIGGSLRYAEPASNYFTHLFIDECGSATEIATLLPIACAPHAKIVLSGDPKQLGPVLNSKHASNMGLGISLLQRLIEMDIYQKHPQTDVHNANLITKLVYNYRSHPAIISPSNQLFYEGDLIAKGDKKNTHCFADWTYLPSVGTPIIFHACTKKSQRENKSTSIFNMDEVFILLNYIERLMRERINGKPVQESDIGIISPYKKQCFKIQEQLHSKGLFNIMVATVELFQGKEKPIILVSTARCKMGGIGFLRSPQRLNVMLTRAQCLMIIVGDPYTLRLDKNWHKVLNDFKKIGVCTGESFDLENRFGKTLADVSKWNRDHRYTKKSVVSKTDTMTRAFGGLTVRDLTDN